MDLSTIVALFNIIVGLMLVMAMLLMGGGLLLWYVRLGTYPTYRDQAIEMMQWACAILFVIVVLLAVAQFVQTHMAIAMMAVGGLIAAAIAYFVATELMAGGGHGDEEH